MIAMIMDSPEFLQRYLQGKLSPEEEAEYEAWFMDKPEVLAQLETQQAIREGFKAAGEESSTKAPVRYLKRRRTDRLFQRAWAPAFAFGAAAGLALAFVAGGVLNKPKPIPNFSIVELGAVRSFADQTAPTVPISPNQSMLALKVQLQEWNADRYTATVRPAESDQVLYEVHNLVPHTYGAVVLGLPTNALNDGIQYEVTVSAASGAQTEPQTFRFQVAEATP